MTKTYEECLEIISRRDYNRDWKDTYLLEGYPTIVQKMKEAAILYGEAKYLQGVNECTEFHKKHPQNSKT